MSRYLSKNRVRYSFGKVVGNVSIPNLIKVQRDSYEDFLQISTPSDARKSQGLQNVLREVFSIDDLDKKAALEYIGYNLESPRYEPDECMKRGVSYSSLLKIDLRLVIWDIDQETGVKEMVGIKEQEVHLCDVPLMTDQGTFIINGAQRVIVSQLHRSPGVFYTHDDGKSVASGKFLYSARIIPYRGSWLDFEFDAKDILYFRIDRKRKLYATTLLMALGLTRGDVIKEFYSPISYSIKDDAFVKHFNPDLYKGIKPEFDVLDFKTKTVILEKGKRVLPRILNSLESAGYEECYSEDASLFGYYVYEDIVDESSGEVLVEFGTKVNEEVLGIIRSLKISNVKFFDPDNSDVGSYIKDTLLLDKNDNEQESLVDIYKILRPGEPSTPEVSKQLFHSLFFDKDRYDLSSVGRMKINKKHDLDIDEGVSVLTKRDIMVIVRHLLLLKSGNRVVDDIDSLSNRRVRSVGELVENQFAIGLVKMKKSIQEKFVSFEPDDVMPNDLINSKILSSTLREFFGISQLSQFMDQVNPLSEITHKRRLSALGPGGLTRDRAGFEVRDVHPTHYSRICPIETPEGQNIGLISSLATHADINKYGFIESPYKVVKDGYVTDEIVMVTAIEEERYTIAKATTLLDDEGKIVDEIVVCHKKGEVINAHREVIDLIDLSPQQLVSVAASLIPFLENDDANRALMGSNMQRQAVPLMRNEAPLVGTGMEKVVASDSGAVVVARRSGVVDQVDSKRIVIKVKDSINSEIKGVDIYNLIKFDKSNQGTCVNQKPIVNVGDFVCIGDIVADGMSTDNGELALGKNVLVAFMPWNGYNFEDSILLSERLLKKDVYTSIHINEYEVVARDTRLGPEEITRDIPDTIEENLAHLDEKGIVNIGAKVEAGDILVGKVTPKSESPLTAEEKLLRAIFGEKAADVRNTSLKLPSGEKGVVVDVKIFTKRGVIKDERALALERIEIEKFAKDKEDEKEIIINYVLARLKDMLFNKELSNDAVVDKKLFESLPIKKLFALKLKDGDLVDELLKLQDFYNSYVDKLEATYNKKLEKLQSGDDLPQGALKVVKVYVANKLKIQPGDKMAGRHGNKGVVSKILPVEDMPFLEDGTPVDIVLNPLGVPSRMNIGQILETHLGWGGFVVGQNLKKTIKNCINAKDEVLRDCLKDAFQYSSRSCNDEINAFIDKLERKDLISLYNDSIKGIKFASPVFDGAKESDINGCLEKAGVDLTGQEYLRDGKTGERFDRKVTVGYIYMMKLDHLVDKKIHARSVGPYSLVTQQPLGGKSHFGGQRFGEMEVWALQAYGAAYTLQEMLTVKSDDVTGRIKAYEAIVRGENGFNSGLPESFKVMIKEISSLGLNIEVQKFDNSDQ